MLLLLTCRFLLGCRTEFPLNIVFKRENAVSDTHAGGNYQFITW